MGKIAEVKQTDSNDEHILDGWTIKLEYRKGKKTLINAVNIKEEYLSIIGITDILKLNFGKMIFKMLNAIETL